ncbi:hypothetical protein SAY86_027037 [Trapa natans]|uniref:Alpha/beta hydrolase fold-3 domain-containing protein n=1 Tax=Trapa natans TaxID=22666 RepID=A0AAN7QIF5_TRANT|nr:hypothetical protein SAY86_027037 [Trapa natans]
MESEILHDLSPMARIYKDGRVERLLGTAMAPASLDEKTGVNSKDVVILPETGLSARLYIPDSSASRKKVPLLVYIHGGGFMTESSQSPSYHTYLNMIVSEAGVVAVSVEYRRVPEHPLPAAHDDCWEALGWVASHSGGCGADEWLNLYADLDRVFLAGDSAGGNIVHSMGMRYGAEKVDGIGLRGMILVHPFFLGSETRDPESSARMATFWKIAYPSCVDLEDDPLLNPGKDAKLSALGCSRVLVCVAEKDRLRDRGWRYGELLRKSGWGGEVEVMESKGEGHVFHLFDPACDNAMDMKKRVVAFLKEEK